MIVNGYATLDELKADKSISSINAVDDTVIEGLIENVSRYIDESTRRWFYPLLQTRLLDVPPDGQLYLDAELLALSSITNGDGNAIASAQYTTRPRNETPYWCVELKSGATVVWLPDSSGNYEGVISLAGVWGYHSRYAQAWRPATTLTAAIVSTTATTISLASAAHTGTGSLIKIDDEYLIITANDLGAVVERGVNGTTPAVHALNAPVYVWRVEGDVNLACRLIVLNVYNNRYGGNPQGAVTVTGAGAVITPADVPAMARDILAKLTRSF